MWAKDPTMGVKASTIAIKVTAARVRTMRSMESRYTLQGRNRDREKHQVENGGRRKVGNMPKEAWKHIIGVDGRMSKELVNLIDNAG